MAEKAHQTVRARQVAAELKRARSRSGLSTTEVGKRLGISQSKVSRMENCVFDLDPDEVAAMLGVYQVPLDRRRELMAMVRGSKEPGWVMNLSPELPSIWHRFNALEADAIRRDYYQSSSVPGIAQTADYAREMIVGTAVTELRQGELAAKVESRMRRQDVLTKENSPEVHILLSESALRAPIGGPAVMARQLEKLVALAKIPRVTIQIIASSVGAHPGLEGSFTILEYESEPTLVNIENRVQTIFLEDYMHVEAYKIAWKRMLARAIRPDRSAEVIDRAAKDLFRRSKE